MSSDPKTAGESTSRSKAGDSISAQLQSLLMLRVLATFAVVFGHASSFFGAFLFTQWPNFPYLQSQAVILFFCVSGFTIAWVCDRDRTDGGGLLRFTFERYMRLIIPLFPIVVIFAAIEFFALSPHPYAENFSLRTAIGNVLLLQNIRLAIPFTALTYDPMIDAFGTNRPLWTISIEFWIYIAFAGFYFSLYARSFRAMALQAGMGFAAMLLLEPYITGGRGSSLPMFWLVGAFLYFSTRGMPPLSSRQRLALAPACIFFLLLVFRSDLWPPDGTYSYLFNLIISANFCLIVLILPSPQPIVAAALKFFGSFAYTTYLVHYPFMYLIQQANVLKQGSPLSVVVAVVASFFIAWLLSLPFERNYKMLRDAFWAQLERAGQMRRSTAAHIR